MGFVRGFLAPFRGAVFVRRQRLWSYLVIPLLLNGALAAGAVFAAGRFVRDEMGELFTRSPVIAWLGFVFFAALFATLLFLVFQPLLAAPFNDLLSEKVERKVRGELPHVPFFRAAGRALVHGVLKVALYGVAVVVGLALTPVTGGLGGVLGAALGAAFLAYDGFDYPLARRGLSFGAKWGFLLRHPGVSLGYGLGTTLLYLIPLAAVVAPPFAAAGATLAFLDLDAAPAKAPRPATTTGAPPPVPPVRPATQ